MQWTKRRIELLVPAFLIFILILPFVVVGVFEVTVEEAIAETFGGAMVSTPAAKDLKLAMAAYLEEQGYPHTPLPEEVRGFYWTAVTARSSWGQELIGYMEETGLNTVVIDVKMDNGQLQDLDSFREILDQLYDEGVYRIVRVPVMRDGAFARANPHLAMQTAGGGFWYDSIGSLWLDPAGTEVADYAIELGEELYELGFDEIQYDYVRFASDGAVSSIVFPIYDRTETKVEVMQRFFERVGGTMRDQEIPVSFDLFGMTFESHYDYNIGQRLVDAFPYADFISPMVYPSHYPDGFKGLSNPAVHPYEIVKWSLDSGTEMMLPLWSGTEEELRQRWRPWIQDFDIGAVYTSDLIKAQIDASRDAGANGWILWNARNVYEWTDYR